MSARTVERAWQASEKCVASMSALARSTAKRTRLTWSSRCSPARALPEDRRPLPPRLPSAHAPDRACRQLPGHRERDRARTRGSTSGSPSRHRPPEMPAAPGLPRRVPGSLRSGRRGGPRTAPGPGRVSSSRNASSASLSRSSRVGRFRRRLSTPRESHWGETPRRRASSNTTCSDGTRPPCSSREM